MGRTLSRTGSIAAVAAALVLHAVTVRAQEGWGTAPTNLSTPVSTGGAIFQPKVDVDAAGNAIALWTDQGPTVIGTGSVVRTARYDAALGQWSSPLTLSSGERIAVAANIATDAAGNAVAVWTVNAISTPFFGRASRYDATTRQWTPVDLGPLNFAVDQVVVALNDAGHGAVCWSSSTSPGVVCKGHAPGTGWADAASVSTAPALVDDVGVDAAGGIHVLFHTATVLQTARFTPGTSTWGSAVDLATGLSSPPSARLAVSGPGHAIASWLRGATVEASTFAAAGSAWAAPATLSSGGTGEDYPRPAIDVAGRATVAWVHTQGGGRTLQVARRDPVGSAWGTPVTLPGQTGGFAYGPAGIDTDASGNVHVVWSQSLASPGLRLLASRFAMSTGQWATVENLSAVSQFAYNPDVATDPAGNATAVWFQSAGGVSVPQALRWLATSPPPTIAAVTPAVGRVFVAPSLPQAPDPALVPTLIEYSLDDGASWHVANTDAFGVMEIPGLVDGTRYQLRLRTWNAAGVSRPTPMVPVRSGTDTAPGSLRVVSRTGNTLTLTWTTPPAGLEPTSYRIEGGLAGQAQVLATLPTGGPATQFTVTVPDGTFFVRVTGLFGGTVLGTSATQTIAAGGAGAPPPPSALLGTASGQALALSWRNALEGPAPTGIRLSVTGALTTTLDLPASEAFTFPSVPPGTYTFTVSALNGATASAASNAVTLTFSGACTGVPNPPTAFSASTQGGSVFLDWLPPTTGAAATSYIVSVTGAFTGMLPMTARTMTTPAPPGRYMVRVAAVGPCGTSAFTPPQTIEVP